MLPFFVLLTSCSTNEISEPKNLGDTSTDTNAIEDSGIEEPQYSFSFVILADPHIIGVSDHRQRLQTAVEWINSNRSTDGKEIDLVLVVGDIGWGDGLYPSLEELRELQIPYVPIIGDNEVAYGSQFEFEIAFEDAWKNLSETFEDYNAQIGEVENTELQIQSSFYNVAFTHKGVRFVCADWSSRESGPILSEIGYLHDFEGGTWPWFEDQILQSAGRPQNSVVISSHIPMILAPGGFAIDEMDKITALTMPYSNEIFANFAGHFHANAELEDGELDVYITDATWDDEVTLRVVDVYQASSFYEYQIQLEVIPYVPTEE